MASHFIWFSYSRRMRHLRFTSSKSSTTGSSTSESLEWAIGVFCECVCVVCVCVCVWCVCVCVCVCVCACVCACVCDEKLRCAVQTRKGGHDPPTSQMEQNMNRNVILGPDQRLVSAFRQQ